MLGNASLRVLLAIAAFISTPATARDTGWLFTPYLWGVSIDGDNPDIDASFSDILDNANFAMSLHTEYRTDQWSFVIDPTYIDLEVEGPLGGDIGIEIWLVEAWAGYVVADGLEVIGGARYQDQEVDPENLPIEVGDNWTDWFAGARYQWAISDKWFAVARADTVVSGDSDSALNAIVFFNRRIGETMALNLGYRYFDSDFNNDETGLSAYAWEVVQDGPVVGFSWTF